jgi:hypothetical protein
MLDVGKKKRLEKAKAKDKIGKSKRKKRIKTVIILRKQVSYSKKPWQRLNAFYYACR